MITNSTSKGFAEVRMRGFSSRATVDQAWAWLDSQTAVLPEESILLEELAGRVLAYHVTSQVNVPAFARAMMDGFAVVAEDTSGASVYNQLPLTVVGEVLPGQVFPGRMHRGQAVRIMTGAPIPLGADSVIPVERVQADGTRILALDEVTPGKHVGRVGEDIAVGTTVLRAGRRLRPQDLGVLSSIGLSSAQVVRKPRVRILVTGNELLPAGSRPAANQIVDANGPMLAALVHRDGATPIDRAIIPDDPSRILEALRKDADVVLISGGSSVGQEDHAPRVLAEHGQLALHGIAMRPSSPAGMGVMDDRLVFLLPGNPVSCLCAYDFFAGRAIRRLAGFPPDWPYRCVRLPLARKLVSVAGRVDYARVKIEGGKVEPLAISGASILTSTTRADGFVIVPHDSEGHPPGAEVDVWLYD
jgi:molybdopterin molybdotransferase